MPRGRGGKVDGVIGKKYANRADLRGQNVVAAQPQNQPGQKMAAQAASGQTYGAATAQKNAQQAVPIVNTSVANVPQATAQGVQNKIQGNPLMGQVEPLNAPTNNGLPLMTGVDAGSGEGSSALIPTIKFDPAAQELNLLNSLGDNVSSQVAYVRNFLNHQTQNQIPQ